MSPMFDWACQNRECEYIFECYTPNRETVPCCRRCGSDCQKVWVGRAPLMIPDSIPGGMVIENLDKHPRTFYSRSDFKHELTARGLTSPLVEGIGSSRFQHRGDPDGSDKSRRLTDPSTGRTTSRSSRWI